MSATEWSTANAVGALHDWLQSVTVHEDMPDLETEVACGGIYVARRGPCPNPAAVLCITECEVCGRFSRPLCREHGGEVVRSDARWIHDPDDGLIISARVVPL